LTGNWVGWEDEGLMVGKNGKGLVGMDEVWGLWNRARGVCECEIRATNVLNRYEC
jgi:ESCRT-II complex subunit VPS36